MATAYKHMLRSRRSESTKTIPVQMFANKAAIKSQKNAVRQSGGGGLLQAIMHRMQNK